jgi:hypothetical protein
MDAEAGAEDSLRCAGLDTTVPHSARIWNYRLGGKDNFAVDRKVGDQLREVYPAIVDLARSDRRFLRRAVSYLAGEAGIRQFLDIGTGLPNDSMARAAAGSRSYRSSRQSVPHRGPGLRLEHRCSL